MDVDLNDPPGFDEDGNPLALMEIENTKFKSEIKEREKIIYLPSEDEFFDIKHLENLKKLLPLIGHAAGS
ncbi:hypothetical protein N9N67_10630 [Bacteriovoracaceae bacterium]|nr:hypothetical protein [Bacteriovoracaceae bacterium]